VGASANAELSLQPTRRTAGSAYLSLSGEVVESYVTEYAELFHADRLSAQTIQRYMLKHHPKGTLLTEATIARIERAVDEHLGNGEDVAGDTRKADDCSVVGADIEKKRSTKTQDRKEGLPSF
jgi:hypothetical protein